MRPRIQLVAALLFAVLLVLALVLYRTSEPRHRGRPLSFWVEQYRVGVQRNDLGLEREEQVAEAQEAIATIGTRGLPLLVSWAKYDPPLPGARFLSWLPLGFQNAIDRALINQEKLNRAEAAMEALQMLGTNAASATRCLASNIKNTKHRSKALRMEYTMSWLGPEALPVMLNFWSNATSVDRSFLSAVIASHMIPTINNRDQLPPLLPLLQLQNDPLRAATYQAVSHIAPDLLTNSCSRLGVGPIQPVQIY